MPVSALVMAVLGYNEDEIEENFMYVMAPFGSHIGYRPTRWLTAYAGVIPDVFLFTRDNGLLLQGRAGVRIDPGFKFGAVMTVGYAKTMYTGFKSPHREFPGGVYFGLSYASPFASGLLD